MYDDSNDSDLMPHPKTHGSVLAELEQSWWALARPAALPMRHEVSALTLGRALPYGFIAQRIAPGHARFRVAGRKISALMGCEARGMPMSCLFNGPARAVFAERLEQVFQTPAIVDMPVIAPRGLGRGKLSGRILILPLATTDGQVDRAMGAVMMDGPAGGSVRRCDIPDLPWRCDPFRPARSELTSIPGDKRLAVRRPDHRPTLRLVVNNA